MNGYKIVNQNSLHFITPTVVGWIDIFSRKVYRDIIISSLKYCIENKGLILHAYVIMSNHLHLVLSAKENYTLSNIIRDFKSFTAKKIIDEVLTNPSESRRGWMIKLFKYYAKYNKNNTTYQFWKRDNHPIELSDMTMIAQRVNYTHLNPVRAGIVDQAEKYNYSSARNYENKYGLIKVEVIDFTLLG